MGVGGRFIGAIGAKADRHHGTPVPVEGDVRFVGPKTYVRDGSYMKGTRVDMGHVAVLRVQGTTIVLTSLRVPPFDATHLRCLGLIPRHSDPGGEVRGRGVAPSATSWLTPSTARPASARSGPPALFAPSPAGLSHRSGCRLTTLTPSIVISARLAEPAAGPVRRGAERRPTRSRPC